MSQLDMFKTNRPPNLYQILLDKAVSGLSRQGFEKSVNYDPDTTSPQCKYRGRNGLRCALGHLIPDEKYNPKWERHTPDAVPAGCGITAACGLDAYNYDDVQWLLDLQSCHDKASSSQDMIDRLREFAKINKLDFILP